MNRIVLFFTLLTCLGCFGEDAHSLGDLSNEQLEAVCGQGTTLNATTRTCDVNTGEGVLVDDTNQVIQDPNALNARLDAARAEGASGVVLVNCGSGTIFNAEGTECIPNLGSSVEIVTDTGLIEPTAQFAEEKFAAGVNSVTVSTCGAGTTIDVDTNACVPKMSMDVEVVNDVVVAKASVLLARFQDGVNSVVPINCGAGTQLSVDGTQCEPKLNESITISVDGELQATRVQCAQGTILNEEETFCEPNLGEFVSVSDTGVLTAQRVSCGVGSELDEASQTCVLSLSSDVTVSSEGDVVPSNAFAEARYEAGRNSVVSISCNPTNGVRLSASDNTTCVAKYDLTTVLNSATNEVTCDLGYVSDELCQESTINYNLTCEASRGLAISQDITGASICQPKLGVSAVVNANSEIVCSPDFIKTCGAGTVSNADGDTCVPRFSAQVELGDGDLIVPTTSFATEQFNNGVAACGQGDVQACAECPEAGQSVGGASCDAVNGVMLSEDQADCIVNRNTDATFISASYVVDCSEDYVINQCQQQGGNSELACAPGTLCDVGNECQPDVNAYVWVSYEDTTDGALRPTPAYLASCLDCGKELEVAKADGLGSANLTFAPVWRAEQSIFACERVTEPTLAVFPAVATWEDAQQDCADRRGDLAWIESAAVNAQVESLCRAAVQGSDNMGCSIGLKTPFEAWTDVDSDVADASLDALGYLNWAEQSEVTASDVYGFMYGSEVGPNTLGKWAKGDGANLPYVCRFVDPGSDLAGAAESASMY